MSVNENLTDNFDKDFEYAFAISDKTYSHDELLAVLKSGNIAEKQNAALKFDYVNNKVDAEALLNNLTGCDGKIREAVAYRINQIIKSSEHAAKIFAECSAEKFAAASVDINANICRMVIESASILKDCEAFAQIYINKIVQYINEAFSEIDKFIFRDKKYVINKQLFKLYWCLEALVIYYDIVPETVLYDILKKSTDIDEYTVREKAAQIIKVSQKFPDLRQKLEVDENYYVKEALHH